MSIGFIPTQDFEDHSGFTAGRNMTAVADGTPAIVEEPTTAPHTRRASGRRVVPVVEVCPNPAPEIGFFHLLWWPTQRYCEQCRPSALDDRARKQKLKRASKRTAWSHDQLVEAAAPIAARLAELASQISRLQQEARNDDRTGTELANVLIHHSNAVAQSVTLLDVAIARNPLASYLHPADVADEPPP